MQERKGRTQLTRKTPQALSVHCNFEAPYRLFYLAIPQSMTVEKQARYDVDAEVSAGLPSD